MDNKTARQDLETVIRVEDLGLHSMRKLRAIQDWLRAEANPYEPAKENIGTIGHINYRSVATRAIADIAKVTELLGVPEEEAGRPIVELVQEFLAARGTDAQPKSNEVTKEFDRYRRAVITGAQRDKVQVSKDFSFADFHAGYRAGKWASVNYHRQSEPEE